MKQFKNLVALVLALALTFSLVGAALADTYDVTITKVTGDTGTHTYGAYQVFAGDLNGDTLSNITWGNGVNSTNLAAALHTAFDSNTTATTIQKPNTNPAEYYTIGELFTAANTAAQFADAIAAFGTTKDSDNAKKLADVIGAHLSSTKSGTGSNTGVAGLSAGYYLIKDTAAVTGTGAETRYILNVVKTVTITEKASIPTVEKKVFDINDSDATPTKSAAQDSADYDIGDPVPFQITVTTGSTVSDYKTYHVTIQDKQSAGLTAPESYTINVMNQTITLAANATQATEKTVGDVKIKVENTTPDQGNTFAIKITFTNKTTGSLIPATANSQPIVVTYTSVLNSSAVFKNDNDVYVKFSNNPNSTDDSEEGTTPHDYVVVFTYTPIVNKVDGSSNPLSGAGFTLYKEVGNIGTAQSPAYPTGAQTGAAISAALKAGNSSIDTSALESTKYYVAKAMTLVSGSQTSFNFKGLDDGTYVLVETTIPAGYNAFVSQKFTITATHTTDGSSVANITLSALTASSVLTTANTSTGTLTGTVENNAGSVLPSTGGIGTTIFYIAGLVLVLGAAAVIIARRKAEQN